MDLITSLGLTWKVEMSVKSYVAGLTMTIFYSIQCSKETSIWRLQKGRVSPILDFKNITNVPGCTRPGPNGGCTERKGEERRGDEWDETGVNEGLTRILSHHTRGESRKRKRYRTPTW